MRRMIVLMAVAAVMAVMAASPAVAQGAYEEPSLLGVFRL